MQVILPSGDPVWVSVGSAGAAGADDGQSSGAQDVGLREHPAAVLHAGQLLGFVEAVRGVVTSVRGALDECRPDEVTVTFGIEITARTGSVLSVLAEAGGSAQIRVNASWGRDGALDPARPRDSGVPE